VTVWQQQSFVSDFRTELKARRDLFYAGLPEASGGVLSGKPPDGAFYAFVKIDPDWARDADVPAPSLSWAFAEHLIKHARIGCVPGVDFGASGEGFIRFAIGRERKELEGALASMKQALAHVNHGVR
jgi:aspartate/methionine/tyrosine aminotransferase